MNQTERVKDCLEELEEIEEKWLGDMVSIGKFLNSFTDEKARDLTALVVMDKYREANEQERTTYTQEQTLWRMACAMLSAALSKLNEEWVNLMMLLDSSKPQAYTLGANQGLISVITGNSKSLQRTGQNQKKQDPGQLDLFM